MTPRRSATRAGLTLHLRTWYRPRIPGDPRHALPVLRRRQPADRRVLLRLSGQAHAEAPPPLRRRRAVAQVRRVRPPGPRALQPLPAVHGAAAWTDPRPDWRVARLALPPARPA